MNRWFTALFALYVMLAAGVALSWLFSGVLTPWGVLVFVMASFVAGAYFGTLWERIR